LLLNLFLAILLKQIEDEKLDEPKKEKIVKNFPSIHTTETDGPEEKKIKF
jgi:hypothetical protein